MSFSDAHFAIFNSYNLASLVAGLTILAIDVYKPPKRDLTIANIARSDKNKVSSGFYNEKNISVRVGISRQTRQATEESLGSLMKLLHGLEKELLVPQAGATRKYTATLSDVVERSAGGAYWEGELVFTCSDVFGYDTAYTTIVNLTGVTSGTRTDQYDFQGSAPQQLPFISIYYSALTGGSNKSVVIGNAATGQQITVTRTWSAGDRLEIDCQNETVKVNGVDVAFTGAFPVFAPGVGNLTYSDDLTTRTFNLNARYYKRWA